MNLERRTLGILSTVHMTARDNEILSNSPEAGPDLLGFMGATEYGFWFSAAIERENWQMFGLSEELFATLIKLFAAGYDRIEFDRDAPVIPELPHFDW